MLSEMREKAWRKVSRRLVAISVKRASAFLFSSRAELNSALVFLKRSSMSLKCSPALRFGSILSILAWRLWIESRYSRCAALRSAGSRLYIRERDENDACSTRNQAKAAYSFVTRQRAVVNLEVILLLVDALECLTAGDVSVTVGDLHRIIVLVFVGIDRVGLLENVTDAASRHGDLYALEAALVENCVAARLELLDLAELHGRALLQLADGARHLLERALVGLNVALELVDHASVLCEKQPRNVRQSVEC